jgi:hypothetical protein
MQPPETLGASSRPSVEPASRGVARRSLFDALRSPAFLFPLAVFGCTRVAMLLFAQVALSLAPDLYWRSGGEQRIGFWPTLDGFCRWDCGHFERLASVGYLKPEDTNFFPLLPLSARLLSFLTTIPVPVTLLIVPNLAALGGLVVIYRIFADLEGTDAARWGVAIFAAYPFAFFQATGYPESLMIFTSALAIWLALRGNHIWAGVALGMGVLARHLTLFAGAGLLAAQVRERGIHPRRFLWNRAIIGLLMPWLFLGGYLLYQYVSFGDALAFWRARANWGERAWWGIVQLAQTTDSDIDIKAMWSYVPIVIAPTVGAIALATRKRWAELAAFALVLMTVLWSVGMWGMGRYSASCWPAFLPLGVWLARHPMLQAPAITLLTLLQGLFFYLFIHQFPIL